MVYSLRDLGIGEDAIKQLRREGIDSPSDLLADAGLPSKRQSLAQRTDITADMLLRWACRADLLRVPGIGPRTACLLTDAHNIYAVQELARQDPEALWDEMATRNPEQELPLRLLSKAHVRAWIEEASRLPAQVGHPSEDTSLSAKLVEASRQEKWLNTRILSALFGAVAAVSIMMYVSAVAIIHFSNVADITGWEELELLAYRYNHRFLRSMYLEGAIIVAVTLAAFAGVLCVEAFLFSHFARRLDSWLLTSRVERSSLLAVKREIYQRRRFLWAGLGLFAVGTLGSILMPLANPGDIRRKWLLWISTVAFVGTVSALIAVVPVGYGVLSALRRDARGVRTAMAKLILSYGARAVYLVVVTTAAALLLPPLLISGVYCLDEVVFLPHRSAMCAEFDSEMTLWAEKRGYPVPQDTCRRVFFREYFEGFLPDAIEWLNAIGSFARPKLLPALFVVVCVGLILVPLLIAERAKAVVLMLFALASYGLGEMIAGYVPEVYLLDRTSVSTIILIMFFAVMADLSLDLLQESTMDENQVCPFCSMRISISDRHCRHCGGLLEWQVAEQTDGIQN